MLEVVVLRLSGGQVESLFDLGLPVALTELPADLAAVDRLLSAPGVLGPIETSWDEDARWFGRPTVPMDRFVRLMIVKARSGWGYETLVREVADSLHLRRFCRISLVGSAAGRVDDPQARAPARGGGDR